MSDTKAIAQEFSRWASSTYQKAKTQNAERVEQFHTLGELPVDPLYVPGPDVAGNEQSIGLPGQYPFTRGVQPNMYRGKLWTMRQFAGFGSPEDTNRRFKYLRSQGMTGLSTAFDMPALMGYDADHALADGEVGKEGVSVSSLDDMERLFDGIPLGDVTTSMTINASAICVMAMYVAVAQKQGVPHDRIAGTLQNDMLKEFIAQKEWMVPEKPSVKLSMDVVEYCSRHLPRFNGVSISGYHIREAGATAAQELAFTLADGLAYVQALRERGLDVDDVAPRLSFFFDVHNDFFEEIAKFRAARRIWAAEMRQRFGAQNPRSWALRTHAQTAGVSLTAQQPMNNVVRVAVQALAGVLGGTNSLHTNSLDETYALPTEESATIALRTQQIIAEESGVASTVDPLAGSYYVEEMTNRIEAAARLYIDKIDQMGGMIRAVEQGYPQREIAESAYRFQQAVDRGQATIVGVNKYVSDANKIQLLKIDERVQRDQIERLQAVKSRRKSAEVNTALQRVREGCTVNRNVFEDVLAAVKCYVTLGELSDVFRAVYGQYADPGYL